MQPDFLLEFAEAADDATLVSPLGVAIDEAVEGMRHVYKCQSEISSSLEQILERNQKPGANLSIDCQLNEWRDHSPIVTMNRFQNEAHQLARC